MSLHANIMFTLGVVVLGGGLASLLAKRFRIPQVVSYILIGLLVGQSGLRLITTDLIGKLQPLNYFALGLIGFSIGGELTGRMFRKYGKQLVTILISEALTAFVVVTLLVALVGRIFIHDSAQLWSLAFLLGAIASATAPAATTDVLWEYRTRGPLTQTILGIVALDDGLALILFAVASSIAGSLMGTAEGGILSTVLHPIIEMTGSVGIGLTAGCVLGWVLKYLKSDDRVLCVSIGALLSVLGLAYLLELDILLSAMALGATLSNVRKDLSKRVFRLLNTFSPPVYIIFFAFVGASMDLSKMSGSILALGGIYLVGRTVGKVSGAYFGARMADAPRTVQKYLPMCLFSQAGVAIGLSILAGQRFTGEIGNTIVLAITGTTFIVQLIGPSCVRIATSKAGEVGLRVTEEDVMRETELSAIIERDFLHLHEGSTIHEVFDIFARNDHMCLPVISETKELLGIVTLESLKHIFNLPADVRQLLLVHDIMDSPGERIDTNATLYDTKDLIDKKSLQFVSAFSPDSNFVGIVETHAINRAVTARMIQLREKAIMLEQTPRRAA
jgi:Kef-type K+ transport system membrane component KefB/CBS domain-containing protein